MLKQTWRVTYFPNEKLPKSEGGLYSVEFFKYACSFVINVLIYEFGQEIYRRKTEVRLFINVLRTANCVTD